MWLKNERARHRRPMRKQTAKITETIYRAHNIPHLISRQAKLTSNVPNPNAGIFSPLLRVMFGTLTILRMQLITFSLELNFYWNFYSWKRANVTVERSPSDWAVIGGHLRFLFIFYSLTQNNKHSPARVCVFVTLDTVETKWDNSAKMTMHTTRL